MRILMCPPTYYGIFYRINPWMNQENKVNKKLAEQQWQKLRKQIINCGAETVIIPPQPGLPDMVFTANAALISNKKAYLAQFAHPERQRERIYFKRFLVSQGFSIYGDQTVNASSTQQTLPFEGCGDALNVGNLLFLGYGLRSDHKTHKDIAQNFPEYQCISLELINSHYYHLDTCFCPIDQKTVLYYPKAFSDQSQQKIKQHLQTIEVPEEEAKRFACNAVVINQQIILPANCPKTENNLIKQGFTVHPCELSEYIKAGGAAKCLTLKL